MGIEKKKNCIVWITEIDAEIFEKLRMKRADGRNNQM